MDVDGNELSYGIVRFQRLPADNAFEECVKTDELKRAIDEIDKQATRLVQTRG